MVKAPGTAGLTDEAPDVAADEGSLQVTINWPEDDEFRFFSVKPNKPRGPAPYRLREVSLWVKGANDPHFLEVHFADANDEGVKVGLARIIHDGQGGFHGRGQGMGL